MRRAIWILLPIAAVVTLMAPAMSKDQEISCAMIEGDKPRVVCHGHSIDVENFLGSEQNGLKLFSTPESHDQDLLSAVGHYLMISGVLIKYDVTVNSCSAAAGTPACHQLFDVTIDDRDLPSRTHPYLRSQGILTGDDQSPDVKDPDSMTPKVLAERLCEKWFNKRPLFVKWKVNVRSPDGSLGAECYIKTK
jgi:hypothetical protein